MSRIRMTVRGVYVQIALALTSSFFYISAWLSRDLIGNAQLVARFGSVAGAVRLEGLDTPILTVTHSWRDLSPHR
jgi:hypothetical protein